MNFWTGYHTDIGISKPSNQDALLIKTANSSVGRIAFLAVCDGLGGLNKGELASTAVTKALSRWFDHGLEALLQKGINEIDVKEALFALLYRENERLSLYGKSSGLDLGTTATAFLAVDESYYILHVGDTRVYKIGGDVRILTDDHTFVARELTLGNIAPEEINTHPKRNVLLQCVGVNSNLSPDFISGHLEKNCVYMLCSDGFRHRITGREIYESFNPGVLTSPDEINRQCIYLTELNKSRMEKDNITVALLKTY